MATTTTQTKSCIYELRRDAALYVRIGESGGFVLLGGAATVLGAPMTPNLRYTYSYCDVRLETQEAARVQLMGAYDASLEACDGGLAAVHAELDVVRKEATLAHHLPPAATAGATTMSGTSAGPRVLVVGDHDRAKIMICHTLLNLATRSGNYGVTYADLDLAGQEITCPGSVGVAFVEAPSTYDEAQHTFMSLDFFIGDDAMRQTSRTRFLDVCVSVEQAVASVAQARPAFAAGGVLLRAMRSSTELGLDVLAECIALFGVTHILLAGADLALEMALRKILLGRPLRVLCVGPVAASSTVAELDRMTPSAATRIMRYFCGTARTPLSPAKGVAEMGAVTLLNAVTLVPMRPEEIPTHALGAVVWANSLQAVSEANVAGYLVLLEVGRRYFSFMAPAAGELPKPFLLISPTIALSPSCIPPLSSVD